MARGGSRAAVTRLLVLGLALLALLCASAPVAAAAEASTEALKTQTQSLYQESQKASAEAKEAKAVAEKSGKEADKAEAEKKAQYSKDVEAKYNEALKAYEDQGGSEAEVAVPKVETAQAVTEEDDSELSKLKSECISWYKRTKEAYAAADKARLATATEGDKADVDEKVAYAKEVEAKWNVVKKEYVEKGGKAQDCETGYTPGETEDDGKDDETDDDSESPECPALIPNDDSKDLFPLSKVDKALVERNCSGVRYPANTHACPIQGACGIRGSNSQCEGTKETEKSRCGKEKTPKECGKAVHVLMPNDYVQKCSENTFLKSKDRVGYQYYCGGQDNNVPECNAICKDNDWCTGWLLVVPNSKDESPRCGKEGSNYKSQAGCNSDVVTPYYGGCGWCFLLDKDYCGPVCHKFGLDKSKVPAGYTPYWAIHGRKKCSEGKDDPHFVGADGTRFEFNGLPDQSFCLLSDEKVHINMKMHGYFDDRLVGASVLKNGKAVRTWMRELGIMWKSEGKKGTTRTHSLYLKARSGPQRERGDGFLASAKLDGKELLPMEAGSNRTFPSGLTLVFKGVEKYGRYDMDMYSVSIDGVIDLSLRLRVAHPLLQTPTDAEAHFNIMVESLAHTSQIHGVIGQTYRDGRAIRSLEYRALSALLGHAVAADGTTGLGYLDGDTKDYVSSGVLSADCKFSAFHG